MSIKCVKSNKGSAMYYVMIVMIVITIILSGVLYLSLRTSVATNNAILSDEYYAECDAALTKLLGSIKSEMLGKSASSAASFFNRDNKSASLFFEKGIGETRYYYPAKEGRIPLCEGERAVFSETPEEEMIIIPNGIAGLSDTLGFEVEEISEGGTTVVYIKDIVAVKKTVSVSTDIALTIQSGKVVSVEFSGYRLSSVQETVEGGDSE